MHDKNNKKDSEARFTILFVFNHRQKKKSLMTRRTFSFDHWMGEKENLLGNVTLFTI